MKMIHIHHEGKPVANGLSFYPLSDKISFGFMFRYGEKIPLTTLGSKLFVWRYSKVTKLWVIRNFHMGKF